MKNSPKLDIKKYKKKNKDAEQRNIVELNKACSHVANREPEILTDRTGVILEVR
jgi:hypothetical protein